MFKTDLLSAAYKPGVRRLDIADFNRLTDREARVALLRCCGSDHWVTGMMARRPFSSFADLFAAADEVWWSLQREDWLETFSYLSQVWGMASWRDRLNGIEINDSPGGDRIWEGLVKASAAYLEKFGYNFFVRGPVKTAPEIYMQLQMRLRHTPETELLIAADQGKQIMTQRLTRWVVC